MQTLIDVNQMIKIYGYQDIHPVLNVMQGTFGKDFTMQFANNLLFEVLVDNYNDWLVENDYPKLSADELYMELREKDGFAHSDHDRYLANFATLWDDLESWIARNK